MPSLSGRISQVIRNLAVDKHVFQEQHARDWLNEIKSDENDWKFMCDAGLRGSSPSHGVIFSLILKRLCIYCPEENALSLVARFSSYIFGDPGLDGCLIELE
jgi:hypothetical protein